MITIGQDERIHLETLLLPINVEAEFTIESPIREIGKISVRVIYKKDNDEPGRIEWEWISHDVKSPVLKLKCFHSDTPGSSGGWLNSITEVGEINGRKLGYDGCFHLYNGAVLLTLQFFLSK